MTPPRIVTVRVDRCRAVTAPATWSQQGLWAATEWMGDDDGYFNMAWTVPVPEGTSLDRIVRALHRVVKRYDTLRTTFEVRDGRLHQIVVGSGSVDIAVYSSPADQAARTAEEVLGTLLPGGFRGRTAWPLRVAVINADGQPRLLVLVVNHMVADLYGWRVVERSLTRLLADASAEIPPSRGWQPVDQAAFEASPSGQRLNRRALAGWTSVLAAAPTTLFDFDTNPGEPEPFWTLRMDSPALAAGLVAVAQRTRVSSSAALLTAMSLVLVAYTGHDEVMVRLNAANRLVEGSQEMAGYLCWNALFFCDLRGLSFDAALRRTFETSVEAYAQGLYDPVRARAIWDEEEHRRGAHIDIGCHLNDRRVNLREAFATVDTAAATLESLTGRTRIWSCGGNPRVDTRIHLHAMDDDPTSIELEFMCDTRYVPVTTMRDLLLAMERLLVAAAHRELSAGEIPEVIAVPPATRGPSWLRCRGGWFDVEATREVWRDVAGPDAMLFAAPGDGGHTILGYYCGSREPAALHRAFVAAVAGRSDVRAPDRYVRCRAAPGDVSDRGAWESMGRGAVTTRRLDRAGGC